MSEKSAKIMQDFYDAQAKAQAAQSSDFVLTEEEIMRRKTAKPATAPKTFEKLVASLPELPTGQLASKEVLDELSRLGQELPQTPPAPKKGRR